MISRKGKSRVCLFIKTLKHSRCLSQSCHTPVKLCNIRGLLISMEDPGHCGSFSFRGVAGEGRTAAPQCSERNILDYLGLFCPALQFSAVEQNGYLFNLEKQCTARKIYSSSFPFLKLKLLCSSESQFNVYIFKSGTMANL